MSISVAGVKIEQHNLRSAETNWNNGIDVNSWQNHRVDSKVVKAEGCPLAIHNIHNHTVTTTDIWLFSFRVHLRGGKDKNHTFMSFKVLLLRQHILRSTASCEANHITTRGTIGKTRGVFIQWRKQPHQNLHWGWT